MARPAVYKWPTPDAAAVCALQTTAGAGAFNLNGTLARPIGNGVFAVPFIGISRAVSLTSAGDVHLVNFTINGTYLNAPVSETIAVKTLKSGSLSLIPPT